MSNRTLTFDIETHSAGLMWTLKPSEMFRLGGYAWDDSPVTLTEDLNEILENIRSAEYVVGHNIHNFDLTVCFGQDSTEPLELALQDRIFDTWTHATLVHPAPTTYYDQHGKHCFVSGPEDAKHWQSLDNQAHQLGVAGKSHDLKALAYEFGDPSLPRAERINDGFGKIPVDDPRFRTYLVQDVKAGRNIAKRLLQLGPLNDYAKRAQIIAAIDAQETRNGFRVDPVAAQARVTELEALRDKHLTFLVDKYDFPSTGKAPLRTTAGKAAITQALNDAGISLDELPRTKKDKKDTDRPSFGGQGLIDAAANHSNEAQELCASIAALGGIRPLAESALKHMQPDGRVHPQGNRLQRSGRKSTQDPGLTIWSSRGKKKVEKIYYIPDHDDHVLVGFDMSQADARIVAAYSGDTEFAKRFAPGVDAHLITANALWPGLGNDRSDPHVEDCRQTAKACSHADAFRGGPRTIAKTAKVDLSIATLFSNTMKKLYPKRLAWQEKVTKLARRGFVVNDWGRKMIVERDREFTQGPALYGQSGTCELMCDSKIRMARRDLRIIQMLKAEIHDEMIFSIHKDEVDYWVPIIRSCMEVTWAPKDGTGQPIFFPCGVTPPASNWMECEH